MAISLPEAEFFAICTEAVLFGAYAVIFVATLAVLHKNNSRRQRSNKVFGLLAMIMFMLSMAHISFHIILEIPRFLTNNIPVFSGRVRTISMALDYVEVADIAFADGILVWRVWMVWQKSCWITAIPLGSLIGTIAASLIFAHLYEPDFTILPQNAVRYATPAGALSLLTNVICTCLISARVWWMQRQLKQHFPLKSNVYQRVLFLVLESGFITASAWIFTLALFLAGSNGLYIAWNAIAQLSGIVPTVIILLVQTNLIGGSDSSEVPTVNFASLTVHDGIATGGPISA